MNHRGYALLFRLKKLLDLYVGGREKKVLMGEEGTGPRILALTRSPQSETDIT